MYTQIHAWLNRTHPLPQRFSVRGIDDQPGAHWLAWVGIESAHALHRAAELKWLTLLESGEIARDYVAKACKVLESDQVEEISDKQEVILKLGSPPPPATPLYIISAGDGAGERVVYVGKTAVGSRFFGGHAAALKLHHPNYAGLSKTIYRCSVTLALDSDHVALEWIAPSDVAEKILDDVESRLIFALKPELNIKKTLNDCAKNKCAVHVQSTLPIFNGEAFMHDFIVPQQ